MPSTEARADTSAPSRPLPRKQREIIQTARRLFHRHGVRRVTVEEIARVAGASKVTFYKYFDNKMDLVRYMLDQMADDADRRLDEIELMDIPFGEKVRLIVDEKLEATRKTSSAFLEDFYADESMAPFARELTERGQRRFVAFIVNAQQQGHVRPEIHPQFILAMLDKLNELAADESLRAHYDSWVEVTREIVDFFFYGLLSEPAQV